MRGIVHSGSGGVYRIKLADGTWVEASLRGRLKAGGRAGDRIVIGDRVTLESSDDHTFTIERVEPRESVIARRGSGGRHPKVLAANVDHMLVVIAAREPTTSLPQIDRLLVIAESNRVSPALVVNKVDLAGSAEVVEQLEATYGPLGYPVLAVSARDGTGLEALRRLVCAGSSALVGPSGVGKSSLLNALDPRLGLRTGELSGKGQRGRHTTVASRLIPLECGGVVADTPGFAEAGIWGVAPAELGWCFPEFREPAGRCRFEDCAHLTEPDCAVRDGVEEGRIAASRFESYRRLIEEARGDGPGG